MNKQQLKHERKDHISEEMMFLRNLFNNTRKEITKVNAYLGSLNHNLKIIKKLLEEVK